MTCDEQVLNLQKIQQSLGARVPRIILQRCEEIFPSLKETLVSVYDCVYSEPPNSVLRDFIFKAVPSYDSPNTVLFHTQTNLTLLALNTFLLTPRTEDMRQCNGFDGTGQCLLPLECNLPTFVEAFGSLPNGFCG
jgi:hypothetical protein